MTNLNNLESTNESSKQPTKTSKFIENTKKAVRDTLMKTWIGVSSMIPTATTTTPSVVPASVNTITAMAPIASTAVKTIWLWTAASLFSACGGGEDWPEEIKDITPPNININQTSADITWWKEIKINGNQLYIWDILVASRSDNKTKNCKVELSLNWKAISSWTTISEEWTLSIKVYDEAGNTKNADIKLNVTKNAPSITVNNYEINIFWWVQVNISNNQLLFWDEVIASRKDDNPESCTISLKLNWQEIKSWDTINDAWTLVLSITNKHSKTSKAEITLTNDAIFGLETLQNANMKVDQEIDLLEWITLADGISIIKTEIEHDGQTISVPDAHHYIPQFPWNISIIFTIQSKNGNTTTIRVDNLTIAPLEYKSITISHLKPSDILPIIGQINIWDKKCYEHIEHLRVAEATKIRDMMRQYGTSKHTPEQYQQLMSRLNTGMAWENPIWFSNYETVWWPFIREPTEHAHDERDTLNNLIKHAKFIVINWNNNRLIELYNLCKSNPNQITIMWSSVGRQVRKNQYDQQATEERKQYEKEKNLIIFEAAWNIRGGRDWILQTKIYQEDYDLPDEHSVYTQSSHAHNKNDPRLDRHFMVTFWTNKDWDIDQTNEFSESSLFPVWFHDKVIFAGREFPRNRLNWNIWAQTYKYATSHTNFVNVAMADLCFQMFAEVKDVDQLLEMIRSTCLTDYIRFDLNGDWDTNDNYKWQPESQPLQLINPAWFFQKYLMPTDLPSQIKHWENIQLKKWYYKWVIFDIPWAEVKINWEWVSYDETNKSLIKSQNPMILEWRLNGNLYTKMWYKWKNIKWKIIVVDDKWNGLNMDKDFSVNAQ